MNTTNKTENRMTEQVKAQGWETPLVDIIESKDSYILEAEMPGVAKDGLEVLLDRSELTLLGRRSVVASSAQALYRESSGRDYRRVFELDPTIDTSRISAQMEQGVLRLTLPKAEHAKPRRITITE
jgi:HSP20 family protein